MACSGYRIFEMIYSHLRYIWASLDHVTILRNLASRHILNPSQLMLRYPL